VVNASCGSVVLVVLEIIRLALVAVVGRGSAGDLSGVARGSLGPMRMRV
jgi:hypothetical protein